MPHSKSSLIFTSENEQQCDGEYTQTPLHLIKEGEERPSDDFLKILGNSSLSKDITSTISFGNLSLTRSYTGVHF